MKNFLLAAAMVLWGCDAATVPERPRSDVYDFHLFTTRAEVLRWPVGSVVRVLVVSDVDEARMKILSDAVNHAIDVWNNAVLYGEVVLQRKSSLRDADVVVQYSEAQSPLDFTGCQPGGALAFTTFCLAADGKHLRAFPINAGGDSRVKFVVTVRTTSATDPLRVRRLVAHEMGHVLGLAQHSPNPAHLMYGSTLSTDEPQLADRATLQVLYHTDVDITP